MLNKNIIQNQKVRKFITVDKEIVAAIEDSVKIVWPAWPLQNTVAVNPFWYFRDKPFEVAMEEVQSVVHTPLMLPINRYLELYQSGDISSKALAEALNNVRKDYQKLPENLEAFIDLSRNKKENSAKFITFADFITNGRDWSGSIERDLGKHAASYLDSKQALIGYHNKEQNFWQCWLEAQKYDNTIEFLGASGFQSTMALFEGLSSLEAITLITNNIGFSSSLELSAYFSRLLASVIGWATQFKYIEWQSDLGYPVTRSTSLIDLLAVRLAYDYGLIKQSEKQEPSLKAEWIKIHKANHINNSVIKNLIPSSLLQYVFQLGWEISYQTNTVKKLNYFKNRNKNPRPLAQMVFCIDVRSEILRRHIEKLEPRIQTIGFAGFFGLPFDYKKTDEEMFSHRLPVLLKPAFKYQERTKAKEEKNEELITNSNREQTLKESFFRNMRKHTLSSFSYVEFFGALYIEKAVRNACLGTIKHFKADQIPPRFNESDLSADFMVLTDSDGKEISTELFLPRLAAVMRHMGLISDFASLVVIVGHGSATTNNAFGSALDCGACGGHAGDINAKLLVKLLNNTSIREGLKHEGINIPSETNFIAAVHETVTDEIYILDRKNISEKLTIELKKLEVLFRASAKQTQRERKNARSDILDNNANRRTQNWSEVRPEWGLAGNACFIVAPRDRTKGVNLSSRSFLHDYNWQLDEKTGFQTLELIMTAPMVVTNWINLQYYASTVAPTVYSSGNKILHNLVNEVGVVEGNGGDLKVGLTLQSIHDGKRFVHDPLRLSVFIEAPRNQIELIIQKHSVVKELIDNGWIHLIHIEPETLKAFRRINGGEYQLVVEDLN